MRFKIGQLVVCVKSIDPKWSALIGAVGEIKEFANGLTKLFGNDYVVDFPLHRDMPCPECGKSHGELFGMADEELAPLEDPDSGIEEEESHDLKNETDA